MGVVVFFVISFLISYRISNLKVRNVAYRVRGKAHFYLNINNVYIYVKKRLQRRGEVKPLF